MRVGAALKFTGFMNDGSVSVFNIFICVYNKLQRIGINIR